MREGRIVILDEGDFAFSQKYVIKRTISGADLVIFKHDGATFVVKNRWGRNDLNRMTKEARSVFEEAGLDSLIDLDIQSGLKEVWREREKLGYRGGNG